MKRINLTSSRRKTKSVPGAELYSTRSPRKRVTKKESPDSLFGWTIFILLLIGLAFACWIGSFYIFGHPENAASYALLRKLNKLEPLKRFSPVAAPPGKFYSAQSAFKFFNEMPNGQLAELNQELLRSYLRNYSDKHVAIPYITGSFSVLGAQELGDKDFITSGYVALAKSMEAPKVLVEQFYPAASEFRDELASMLVTGIEVKLQRTYDLSAVVHIEKLGDGRIQFTVVPINYDSYGLGEGRDVRLSPPDTLNLSAGLPAIRGDALASVQENHEAYLARTAPGVGAATSAAKMPVLARTGPTPDQTVTRVARALPVGGTPLPIPKNPKAISSPSPPVVAEATPSPTPMMVLKAIPVHRPKAQPAASVTPSQAADAGTPKPVITSASSQAPEDKTWKTYAAGQMPRGKLINVSDLESLADHGGPSETTYLQGDFVVTVRGDTRAVLRNASAGKTRIIVDFPPGATPPKEGSQVSRGSGRAFQITNVRRGENGQVNVFVREVTTP